jgi:DUF1680 family protein
MRNTEKITILLSIGFFLAANSHGQDYPGNQAPLVPQKYIELPLGSIRPEGWLREQLEIMDKGLTGHLEDAFPAIVDDNGWLGGKGESLEATPYWLDGALPLAYSLDNKALKDKIQKYIDWVLDNQRPSGYFGPFTKCERETGKKVVPADQGDDWWPRMIMLKVLEQYYSATGDKRVIPFMTNYSRFQYDNLSDTTRLINRYIEQTANSRCEENIMEVYWLYNYTKDPFLFKLADKLHKQTYAWDEWLGKRDWLIDAAAQQNADEWTHRHGVNVAMALKTPAVYYQADGDPKYLEELKTGFDDLMTLHGLPNGAFSADEDLHGNSPTQATELCAIVEAMFSMEVIMGITGDITYMDALERLAFNALPAQTTDDYRMRQYLQMPNQVYVSAGDYDFSYCESMSNVFGTRTGWYCCLVNMHQGWPKYTSHLWYATPNNGLAALVYGPSTVTAKVGNGVPVTIHEVTRYPFGNQIDFTIETANPTVFPLEFRIPGWCTEAAISLNGKPLQTEKGGNIACIGREWKNGDRLTVVFPMPFRTGNWARNSRTVERGPLVYALKVGEKWEKKNDPGLDTRAGRSLAAGHQTLRPV